MAVAFSSDGSASPWRPPMPRSPSSRSGHGAALGQLEPRAGARRLEPDDAALATSSFALDEQAALTIWDGETYAERRRRRSPATSWPGAAPTAVASEKDEPDLRVWDWRADDVAARRRQRHPAGRARRSRRLRRVRGHPARRCAGMAGTGRQGDRVREAGGVTCRDLRASTTRCVAARS